MEAYLTEEERLEALQRWWKENRQSLILGVLLGVAVIIGWNMWQGNVRTQQEQASNLYQQMLKAAETKQTEPAIKLGERVVATYPSTTYADYARLLLAKLKVDSNDLAGAKTILEETLAKTKDENFKHIARLRLGQVMLASGEIGPALGMLEPLTSEQMGKFAGLYEELKGDLYAAANRPDEARKAYETAKQFGEPSPLLELKLNDLPTAPKPAGP
ncbi:tetratricopeptide repeat protein [Methylocaldum sp.]|uniref:YfgM family protein n=1 Tax=Methylocaldum sp. TaxID=1969727 RepID=UPI002D379850|nr:tetratricopeptide repeat protein [Methylocaldum sp.]HYE34078.1 tetratricopeptide repeat protein [Methylocaldum sp.]